MGRPGLGARIKERLRVVRRSLPVKRQAALVARWLPASMWYRTALMVCRAQGRLAGSRRAMTEAVMLDHWMWELTRHGAYPIPYRVHGMDVVNSTETRVFVWTHTPLAELPLQVVVKHDVRTPVVADPGNIVEGKVLVRGLQERVQAIPADAYAILKARTLLRKGVSVTYLADPWVGGPLTDHPMRAARLAGAAVVFQWCERQPDGSIDITFTWAPRKYVQTDADIEANMAFLLAENHKALRSLGFEV